VEELPEVRREAPATTGAAPETTARIGPMERPLENKKRWRARQQRNKQLAEVGKKKG
jgi:hypothetical protein